MLANIRKVKTGDTFEASPCLRCGSPRRGYYTVFGDMNIRHDCVPSLRERLDHTEGLVKLLWDWMIASVPQRKDAQDDDREAPPGIGY